MSRDLDVPVDEDDPAIRAALNELRHSISARWPAATFSEVHWEDPEGIYLRAIVDVDDLDQVVDAVLERMVEFNELGLPVYVIPDWPRARLAAHLRQVSTPGPIEWLLPIG